MDELEKFLNSAHGDFQITVDGMSPHISGNGNDAGILLAAFGLVKYMESQCENDFENALEIMRDLNMLLGYEIKGVAKGKEISRRK